MGCGKDVELHSTKRKRIFEFHLKGFSQSQVCGAC